MSKKTTRKKVGRPQGARTEPRKPVVCLPPVCPSCGQSVEVNLKTKPYRVLEHAGELPDGTKYRRMEWRHVRCPCGQALSVRTPIA